MTDVTGRTEPHELRADRYEHYEPFDTHAALRSQIARTRADLGDTISELASRTDVKARATQMVHDVRSRARQAVRQRARRAAMRARGLARSGASSAQRGLQRVSRNPAPVATGAGVGAALGWAMFVLVRRRKRNSSRAFGGYAPWARGLPMRMGKTGARGLARHWGMR
jgi:hypothetical protein